jgi:hypothetical protein
MEELMMIMMIVRITEVQRIQLVQEEESLMIPMILLLRQALALIEEEIMIIMITIIITMVLLHLIVLTLHLPLLLLPMKIITSLALLAMARVETCVCMIISTLSLLLARMLLLISIC